MYRHLRKSLQGDAIQFREDGSNDATIAAWFGLSIHRVNEAKAVSAHTANGTVRRANRGNSSPEADAKGRKAPKTEGDWIIKTRTGTLIVCAERDFAEAWAKKDDDFVAPKPKEPEPKDVRSFFGKKK